MSQLSHRPASAIVGQSQQHESAAEHVTGTALYTDDLDQRFAGVLHAYPVQSTHAHAKILNLDTTGASAIPGVVRVITAADIPGVNDQGAKHDEPMLPTDEVMFYGQPVAWVLGEDLEAAKAGANTIIVEYEPLESLITIQEAIAAQSFHGMRPKIEKGNLDGAFDDAAHIFEGTLSFPAKSIFI